MYVTGYYYSNPLTINNFVSAGTPIAVTPYGTLTNRGSINIFIVKYNTTGQIL